MRVLQPSICGPDLSYQRPRMIFTILKDCLKKKKIRFCNGSSSLAHSFYHLNMKTMEHTVLLISGKRCPAKQQAPTNIAQARTVQQLRPEASIKEQRFQWHHQTSCSTVRSMPGVTLCWQGYQLQKIFSRIKKNLHHLIVE